MDRRPAIKPEPDLRQDDTGRDDSFDSATDGDGYGRLDTGVTGLTGSSIDTLYDLGPAAGGAGRRRGGRRARRAGTQRGAPGGPGGGAGRRRPRRGDPGRPFLAVRAGRGAGRLHGRGDARRRPARTGDLAAAAAAGRAEAADPRAGTPTSTHTVDRDRHRRHAVPGRLGDRAADRPPPRRAPAGAPAGRGAPGAARPADRGRRRRRAGRRDRRRPGRELDADRDRPGPRRARPGPAAPRVAAGARPTCGRRSRTGRRCASAPWRSPTSWPPPVPRTTGHRCRRRTSPTRWSCCAGSPTTTSPSSATASTGWSTATDGERRWRRCSAPGWASCAATQPEPRPLSSMTPEAHAKVLEKRLLIITKANSRATVHRSAYLDYIGFKIFNDAGEVVGERRFLGLFSTPAYRTSVRELPVVRRKVAEVLDRSGLQPAQPLRQGPAADPGDLPARRAVPDQDRRPVPRGHRRAADGRPPAAAGVPAPGRVRPVHLLPDLPAPGPVHHPEPAAHAGDPAAGAERRRGRLHHPGHRVDAGPGALHRAHRPDRPARRRSTPTCSPRSWPTPPGSGTTTTGWCWSASSATSRPSTCSPGTPTRSRRATRTGTRRTRR